MFEQPPQPEQQEYGKDCEIKIVFRRHAHKEVFDPHEDGVISDSSISQKGREAAFELGASAHPLGDRVKAHVSPISRTAETAGEIVSGMKEGYENRSEALKVYRTQQETALNAPYFSPQKIAEYRQDFTELPEDFDELTTDEQEQLIEAMEIPAANKWIQDWDTKTDENSESAAEVAQKVAEWVAQKDRMIERLHSGSKVELLAVTHRTATEPFLLACIGKTSEEIGGPLELLEGWELTIATDESGQKSYKIVFRGQEYTIDLNEVKEKLSIKK